MNAAVSCEETLCNLVSTFDAGAAGGLSAEIQFIFSGSETGAYYLQIANGKCTLHKGEVNFARLTIRVDADVWRKIQSGEISWTDAMMQRRFTATGNFPLLARLPQIFKIG